MSLHLEPKKTTEITKKYFCHKQKDRVKAHATALEMRVHGSFDTVNEAIKFMDDKRTFMRRQGTWNADY